MRPAPDVRVASGSPQTALAYAASTEPGYVTTFPAALVVRVSGGPHERAGTSVRFRCVTPHCRFAASIQPDDVKRVDPQSYDVRLRKERASLRPTLATDAPGTFTVEVRLLAGAGESPGAAARFTLTAR